MKKLICMLLAVAMLVALAGCGQVKEYEAKPQDQQPEEEATVEITPTNLSGIWRAEIDLSEFLNNELCEYEALSIGILLTEFMVTVSVEFHEDGTYRIWVDEETIDAAFEVMMEEVRQIVWQDIEMSYMDPESDLTLEEILKQEGVDPDKDVEEIRKDQLTEGYVSQLKGRIDCEGKYELINDELYRSEDINESVDKNSCDIISLSVNELVFIESYYADEDYQGTLLYPLTFQRVQ